MIKQTSQTRPEVTELQPNGSVRFNFNVKETNDMFEFDSIDVVGEFTRDNICHAYLLDHYTQEEIIEMLNSLCESNVNIDKLRWKGYNALKDVINGWIDILLGESFE